MKFKKNRSLESAEAEVKDWGVKETIYLCGPMTGLPEYNYPKFNQVAKELRDKGHEVLNPAEIRGDDSFKWEDYMRRAIGLMVKTDKLHVLQGYESSKGAMVEIALAQELGIPISFEGRE